MTLHSFTFQKGFTLVETLVVVALSAAMLIALALLIFMFNKTSSYDIAVSQSSGSASAIMREIQSLVVPAHAVLASHTFSTGTYSSSASTLVLEIPSYDSAGEVISGTYDYAVFYITGTSVYRLVEANGASSRSSGTKRLSTTVSSLSFTYNSGTFSSVHTVTVDVGLQTTVKQDTFSDHRREQVRLRNY